VAAVDPLGGRSVADLRDIVQLVEEDLARVEELFEAQFRSDVRLVGEIGRYIREGGGKRIRPALLLLACRLCGYRGDRAITLASVVEFIHTATLLHDDIIDEATVRRGRRSVNSRWGNDITVLLGDFLYTKSMSMALSQDNLHILRLLSDVTLRMIEGELLEIEGNADLRMSEAQHLDIIRRKTADLFSACMAIGALLGEVGAEKQQALAAYGLNLGICFQMVDDLLDFTADEKVLGKPVASDLREQLQSSLGSAYVIDRELGGGGMSRVFAAEEVRLGRRVVVKMLPPEMAAAVSMERFKREIMFAARLQHPAGRLALEPTPPRAARSPDPSGHLRERRDDRVRRRSGLDLPRRRHRAPTRHGRPLRHRGTLPRREGPRLRAPSRRRGTRGCRPFEARMRELRAGRSGAHRREAVSRTPLGSL